MISCRALINGRHGSCNCLGVTICQRINRVDDSVNASGQSVSMPDLFTCYPFLCIGTKQFFRFCYQFAHVLCVFCQTVTNCPGREDLTECDIPGDARFWGQVFSRDVFRERCIVTNFDNTTLRINSIRSNGARCRRYGNYPNPALESPRIKKALPV